MKIFPSFLSLSWNSLFFRMIKETLMTIAKFLFALGAKLNEKKQRRPESTILMTLIATFLFLRVRCKRLREMKCCSKRSRVAPAEATVCCPPERRFGAICRRLFDNCKCKRNAEAERARNTRAKHSLTSVAPPPLSEVILRTQSRN